MIDLHGQFLLSPSFETGSAAFKADGVPMHHLAQFTLKFLLEYGIINTMSKGLFEAKAFWFKYFANLKIFGANKMFFKRTRVGASMKRRQYCMFDPVFDRLDLRLSELLGRFEKIIFFMPILPYLT